MMILLIDNYDSFTYNLYQYLGELGADLTVRRNNKITLEEIRTLNPEKIVISPGPCTPAEAGISNDIIKTFYRTIPILGVCLGHQCIGAVFGGKIVRAPEIMHGKISRIHHDSAGIFAGLPNPFEATRYHSLIIERESLPDCLCVTAQTEDATIMGVRHKEAETLTGVQFHPESIKTDCGKEMLKNFLSF